MSTTVLGNLPLRSALSVLLRSNVTSDAHLMDYAVSESIKSIASVAASTTRQHTQQQHLTKTAGMTEEDKEGDGKMDASSSPCHHLASHASQVEEKSNVHEVVLLLSRAFISTTSYGGGGQQHNPIGPSTKAVLHQSVITFIAWKLFRMHRSTAREEMLNYVDIDSKPQNQTQQLDLGAPSPTTSLPTGKEAGELWCLHLLNAAKFLFSQQGERRGGNNFSADNNRSRRKDQLGFVLLLQGIFSQFSDVVSDAMSRQQRSQVSWDGLSAQTLSDHPCASSHLVNVILQYPSFICEFINLLFPALSSLMDSQHDHLQSTNSFASSSSSSSIAVVSRLQIECHNLLQLMMLTLSRCILHSEEVAKVHALIQQKQLDEQIEKDIEDEIERTGLSLSKQDVLQTSPSKEAAKLRQKIRKKHISSSSATSPEQEAKRNLFGLQILDLEVEKLLWSQLSVWMNSIQRLGKWFAGFNGEKVLSETRASGSAMHQGEVNSSGLEVAIQNERSPSSSLVNSSNNNNNGGSFLSSISAHLIQCLNDIKKDRSKMEFAEYQQARGAGKAKWIVTLRATYVISLLSRTLLIKLPRLSPSPVQRSWRKKGSSIPLQPVLKKAEGEEGATSIPAVCHIDVSSSSSSSKISFVDFSQIRNGDDDHQNRCSDIPRECLTILANAPLDFLGEDENENEEELRQILKRGETVEEGKDEGEEDTEAHPDTSSFTDQRKKNNSRNRGGVVLPVTVALLEVGFLVGTCSNVSLEEIWYGGGGRLQNETGSSGRNNNNINIVQAIQQILTTKLLKVKNERISTLAALLLHSLMGLSTTTGTQAAERGERQRTLTMMSSSTGNAYHPFEGRHRGGGLNSTTQALLDCNVDTLLDMLSSRDAAARFTIPIVAQACFHRPHLLLSKIIALLKSSDPQECRNALETLRLIPEMLFTSPSERKVKKEERDEQKKLGRKEDQIFQRLAYELVSLLVSTTPTEKNEDSQEGKNNNSRPKNKNQNQNAGEELFLRLQSALLFEKIPSHIILPVLMRELFRCLGSRKTNQPHVDERENSKESLDENQEDEAKKPSSFSSHGIQFLLCKAIGCVLQGPIYSEEMCLVTYRRNFFGEEGEGEANKIIENNLTAASVNTLRRELLYSLGVVGKKADDCDDDDDDEGKVSMVKKTLISNFLSLGMKYLEEEDDDNDNENEGDQKEGVHGDAKDPSGNKEEKKKKIKINIKDQEAKNVIRTPGDIGRLMCVLDPPDDNEVESKNNNYKKENVESVSGSGGGSAAKTTQNEKRKIATLFQKIVLDLLKQWMGKVLQAANSAPGPSSSSSSSVISWSVLEKLLSLELVSVCQLCLQPPGSPITMQALREMWQCIVKASRMEQRQTQEEGNAHNFFDDQNRSPTSSLSFFFQRGVKAFLSDHLHKYCQEQNILMVDRSISLRTKVEKGIQHKEEKEKGEGAHVVTTNDAKPKPNQSHPTTADLFTFISPLLCLHALPSAVPHHPHAVEQCFHHEGENEDRSVSENDIDDDRFLHHYLSSLVFGDFFQPEERRIDGEVVHQQLSQWLRDPHIRNIISETYIKHFGSARRRRTKKGGRQTSPSVHTNDALDYGGHEDLVVLMDIQSRWLKIQSNFLSLLSQNKEKLHQTSIPSLLSSSVTTDFVSPSSQQGEEIVIVLNSTKKLRGILSVYCMYLSTLLLDTSVEEQEGCQQNHDDEHRTAFFPVGSCESSKEEKIESLLSWMSSELLFFSAHPAAKKEETTMLHPDMMHQSNHDDVGYQPSAFLLFLNHQQRQPPPPQCSAQQETEEQSQRHLLEILLRVFFPGGEHPQNSQEDGVKLSMALLDSFALSLVAEVVNKEGKKPYRPFFFQFLQSQVSRLCHYYLLFQQQERRNNTQKGEATTKTEEEPERGEKGFLLTPHLLADIFLKAIYLGKQQNQKTSAKIPSSSSVRAENNRQKKNQNVGMLFFRKFFEDVDQREEQGNQHGDEEAGTTFLLLPALVDLANKLCTCHLFEECLKITSVIFNLSTEVGSVLSTGIRSLVDEVMKGGSGGEKNSSSALIQEVKDVQMSTGTAASRRHHDDNDDDDEGKNNDSKNTSKNITMAKSFHPSARETNQKKKKSQEELFLCEKHLRALWDFSIGCARYKSHPPLQLEGLKVLAALMSSVPELFLVLDGGRGGSGPFSSSSSSSFDKNSSKENDGIFLNNNDAKNAVANVSSRSGVSCLEATISMLTSLSLMHEFSQARGFAEQLLVLISPPKKK